MALTKTERIQISSDLTGIADEITSAEEGLESLDAVIEQAKEKDDINKKFSDERTVLIDPYQSEATYLDGIVRTVLTEQDVQNSARRLAGNTFYPADPNIPTPSLPDGVWKGLTPFGRTHAVGKNTLEAFLSTGARVELDILSDINSKIATIESQPIPNNATGQKCVIGSNCTGETPPGSGIDEATCDMNGGVWDENPADTYITDTIVTTLLAELKVLINEWETSILAQNFIIPTDDSNSTRNTSNQNAISDITNSISVIDAWQSIQDFDTTTTLPPGSNGTGCVVFDAMVEGDFQPAKLQPTATGNLKTEVTARISFITVRSAELVGDNYLGSFNQDLKGSLTDVKGLYGERMLFLNLRIGLLGGTLTEVIGLEASVEIQGKTKEGSENKQLALELVMKAVKLAAPAIDTFYLNIIDITGFSVGDRVYVVADDQEELSGSIEEVLKNRVKLTFKTPKKYTTDNNTRMYKLL